MVIKLGLFPSYLVASDNKLEFNEVTPSQFGNKIGLSAIFSKSIGTKTVVEPDKVEEFARATDTLILNPQLRDYLGNNGKSRAKSNFSIIKHRKKITDLYQTILPSK